MLGFNHNIPSSQSTIRVELDQETSAAAVGLQTFCVVGSGCLPNDQICRDDIFFLLQQTIKRKGETLKTCFVFLKQKKIFVTSFSHRLTSQIS